MFYIFKKDPLATSLVKCVRAETETSVSSELRKSTSSALFVYNEETDEINILSEFYDVFECSYFIYTLLGVFKSIKTLKPIHSTK